MNAIVKNEGNAPNAPSETTDILADLETLKGGVDKWMAHIRHLEDTLRIAEEVCIDMIGIDRGNAELRRLALEEIAKFDPSNKLLDPNYRHQIGTKIRRETIASFSRSEPSPCTMHFCWAFSMGGAG